MTNSRDKGLGYELKIAKTFTTWAGDAVIRTPQSGGWQGTSGDIIFKNRERYMTWLCECKKEEDWSLEAVMTGRCSLFTSWWDQLHREVKQDYDISGVKRTPILVFSRNYKPDFVSMLDLPLMYDYDTIMSLKWRGLNIEIAPLDDFITTTNYSDFENFTRSYPTDDDKFTWFWDIDI